VTSTSVAPRRKPYPGALLVALAAIRAKVALQRLDKSESLDTHDTRCLEAGLDLLGLVHWLNDDAWRSNPTAASSAINEISLILRAGTRIYGQAPEAPLIDLARRSQAELDMHLPELIHFFQTLHEVAMAA
jgi:hypothetical protein